MNFYRTGKIVSLTAGTEFELNSSAYKHKAVLLPNGSGLGGLYGIKFYDPSTNAPLGITLTIPTVGSSSPFIIPSVIKSITSVTNSVNIVLLS
jgi:hypothetical protein